MRIENNSAFVKKTFIKNIYNIEKDYKSFKFLSQFYLNTWSFIFKKK